MAGHGRSGMSDRKMGVDQIRCPIKGSMPELGVGPTNDVIAATHHSGCGQPGCQMSQARHKIEQEKSGEKVTKERADMGGAGQATEIEKVKETPSHGKEQK